MDSSAPHQAAARFPGTLARRFFPYLRPWWPLLLLASSFAYGILVALWQTPTLLSQTLPAKTPTPPPAVTQILPETGYRLETLASVLANRRWQDASAWQPTDNRRSGIGYPYRPATYRVTLANLSDTPVERNLVLDAPYLDHVQPALISPDHEIQTLIAMGDSYPNGHRLVDLPTWIWPVTLAPGRTTLLVEVRNNGPVVLPLSLVASAMPDTGDIMALTWKSFISGVLVFALILNLSTVIRLRKPGLGWLSVFMAGLIHSQLVMDGLGFWLLWPELPVLNTLLGISLPLCLLALCEFTPHFISVSKTSAAVLRLFSLLAGVHLLAAPFGLRLIGQDSLLALSALGGAFILSLVVRYHRRVYDRYFGLSVLSILIGAIITSLRTIGWLPVTPLTDSAFFLGAALGSVILTSGIGRLLVEERKRRLGSDIQARQERKLRTRVEQDIDRLMKTHRVTGKPNRPMLEETLDGISSQAHPYSVCMIRLARINELEQALGYRTTEDLLKQYLRRLNGFLKRTVGDRLIMVNGFAVSSLDAANHAFAFYRNAPASEDDILLDAIVAWLGTNFREGRFSFSWAPSIGLAHAPQHGGDASSILSSAGFASLDDSHPLTIYDPAVADWQYRQQILMLELEASLRSDDMWLEYQPKVCIRDGRIASFEALLRWHHSEFGRVSPEQWIPVAEEVGLIPLVTEWVLDRACRDFARLRERHGPDIAVSINVSAKDLARPSFPERVIDTAERHGLRPGNLILEITETAVMDDTELARNSLFTLSQRGFRIALDDFGTGHSSLGTLASFELDELKIDRSFLKDIMTYPRRQNILRVALDLGETLNLDVVVEGVEDEATAVWLQQFPGLYGQGYYWGRPTRLPDA